MLGLNSKLADYESQGKKIRVALIGAGQMGTGMVSQMTRMKAMVPALIVDINIESAKSAFRYAGISDQDVVEVKNVEALNQALSSNKYIVSTILELATKGTLIDVVVEATGVPDIGAKVAIDAIFNKKHMVMLNVETDVVIGPLLKQMADSAGVIYTGTAGDEPGSVRELYDFADAMGLEIVAIGKGKNNPVNLASNPDSVKDQAIASGVSPRMLTEFKDGTKTMIEMAAMANSMGFTPDIRGAHGAIGTVDELSQLFRLKKDGGILSRYGVVDYVNGVAPGVFIIVTTDSQIVHDEMKYLSMGNGPLYTLYRPYHLTSLETPLTAARAVLYHEPTIVPRGGKLVAEVLTVAKKDLVPGDIIDGIGGYTVYGSIDTYEVAVKENALPIGLAANSVVKTSIQKGTIITKDMVDMDTETLIYKLRDLQEKLIG